MLTDAQYAALVIRHAAGLLRRKCARCIAPATEACGSYCAMHCQCPKFYKDGA